MVLAWLRLDNPPDSLDVGLVDVGLVDIGLVDAGLVDAGLVDVGLLEAVLDDGLDGDLAVLVVFLETMTGLVGNGLLKTGAFSFRLCVVTENEDILVRKIHINVKQTKQIIQAVVLNIYGNMRVVI